MTLETAMAAFPLVFEPTVRAITWHLLGGFPAFKKYANVLPPKVFLLMKVHIMWHEYHAVLMPRH